MINRFLGILGVMITLVVVVALTAIPRANQASEVEQSDWQPPRLSDGQPDMQGMYIPNWRTTVPIERWTEAERQEYRVLLSQIGG